MANKENVKRTPLRYSVARPWLKMVVTRGTCLENPEPPNCQDPGIFFVVDGVVLTQQSHLETYWETI